MGSRGSRPAHDPAAWESSGEKHSQRAAMTLRSLLLLSSQAVLFVWVFFFSSIIARSFYDVKLVISCFSQTLWLC